MPSCIHEIEEAWCGFCTPAVGPESPLESWIDAVSLVIPGEDDEPAAADDLAEAAGLSRQQFNRAVAAIRERHPDLPLYSDRNGIQFTADAGKVTSFRNRAARTALTRIRRGYRGVLLPYLRVAGVGEVEMRRTTRQFDRLLEDIEEVVAG